MTKFVTVGIAGHVDHGKTSLVRCLSGIDTDRKQLEKRRGLSIDSGIARLELDSRAEIALIDVPGHKSFLKNAIRGLSSVDMAILMVAADDGVMPQTLEHMEILSFFKIKSGFIVLSKADLVDDEILELAELEIRETLKGTFLEGKPVFPFSAINGRGIDVIRRNIGKEVEKIAGKNPRSPFRLWIDQVRGFPGFGTIVCGTILSGTVTLDDPLHLLPSVKKTRVRSLEVHHRKVSEAFAGQRVGINLPKVPIKEVSRGMTLAKPEASHPSCLLNAELMVLKNALRPIINRQRVKLYLGTSVTNVLVVLMEKERLEPGEKGLVQLRLMKPLAAFPQDPFVICPLNIQTVIGGGTVLEIPKIKYRKAKASAILPYLEALQEGDLKKAIEYYYKANSTGLISEEELARNSGFSITQIQTEIQNRVQSGDLLDFKNQGFYWKDRYLKLKSKLLAIIEKVLLQDPFKKAVNTVEIKDRLAPFLDEVIFQRMLAELFREGKLIKVKGGFQIPDLSIELSTQQERLVTLLIDYAQDLGFVTFSAGRFCKFYKGKFNKNEVQRLLDYLHHQKKLVRLNNKHFISSQVMEEIKDRVKKIIVQKGTITLADSKEILGYGRSGGVRVFEYLDAIGFTRREGNERVLQK